MYRTIATSGYPYIDIDAFAGCIAYSELMNLIGEKTCPVSSATWNESIPLFIQPWGHELETTYSPKDDDKFAVIDVSDPGHFDPIVNKEKVVKVIDHHPGLEDYWTEKLGQDVNIAFIGSAATLIYEEWDRAGLLSQMKPTTAGLLVAAILDNTLDFGAKVTTERDKTAYKALLLQADLPVNWKVQYFHECQLAISANLPKAIQNDLKILEFFDQKYPLCIGQLVVWDAQEVLISKLPIIREELSRVRSDWFMNLVSIKDHASYIIASGEKLESWLHLLLDLDFSEGIAKADRLWLRKEIVKRSLENQKSDLETLL